MWQQNANRALADCVPSRRAVRWQEVLVGVFLFEAVANTFTKKNDNGQPRRTANSVVIALCVRLRLRGGHSRIGRPVEVERSVNTQ